MAIACGKTREERRRVRLKFEVKETLNAQRNRGMSLSITKLRVATENIVGASPIHSLNFKPDILCLFHTH